MRAATPGRLAALMRLQRNALTTVLVIGGSARQRLETGLAFHRRSFLRRGPFVARDAVHDEHGLGRAFAARGPTTRSPTMRSPPRRAARCSWTAWNRSTSTPSAGSAACSIA
jgi:hypothetical protein